MSVWRHITHPDGMTVSLLVAATGLSAEQVRAELRALEQDGKAWRERANRKGASVVARNAPPAVRSDRDHGNGPGGQAPPYPERPARSAATTQHARRQSRHPANPGLVGNGKASAPHRGRRRFPLRLALQSLAILNP